MFLYLHLGIQLFFKGIFYNNIFFPLFMVIIFIISYYDNLFMIIFIYMCIIFISLYNVYIGKLTFNQLLLISYFTKQ